jgi:hypothetical protein
MTANLSPSPLQALNSLKYGPHNTSLDRSALSGFFIRKIWMAGSLSPRPVNCYVNVKPLSKIKEFWFLVFALFLVFRPLSLALVVEAVGAGVNSERFWRRVFPSFHSLDCSGLG